MFPSKNNETKQISNVFGTHSLFELKGSERLDDLEFIERTMRDTAQVSGATVLNGCFHRFGEGEGITGVLLLAESHISIHTWPEHHYAAIDLFLCGQSDVDQAVSHLISAFKPRDYRIQKINRGY